MTALQGVYGSRKQVMATKRVALYIRVSTAEQKIHGLSLETQRENLDAWAKRERAEIVGHYIDAGISARKKASVRPGLQQMLADVKANKIDLIVFTKLDRWFRNVGEYYKVQEILEQHHVDWKTIQEDYDTSTAAGRLKINIMLSVAQDEADRTSERIKVIFDSKRQRREPLTGNAPTGYRVEGKRLVKDENTEAAVNTFFRTYLSTGSISEAQDAASREHGLRLEYQLASKMLGSPAYYGHYYDVDDMCPPYITREEFDHIQAMRQRTVRKVKEDRVYLYSGLIVCGECGYRMGGRTNARNHVPLYNCPSCYVRKVCSNHTNLSERKIEAYIIDTIDLKLERYKVEYERLMKGVQEKSYRPEIANLRSKLAKLKTLYLNDLITLEEYKADQASMTARIVRLEELERPKKRPDFERLEAILVDRWKESYQELSRPHKRDFWRLLVKEIRLYADRHLDYDLNL